MLRSRAERYLRTALYRELKCRKSNLVLRAGSYAIRVSAAYVYVSTCHTKTQEIYTEESWYTASAKLYDARLIAMNFMRHICPEAVRLRGNTLVKDR